MNNFKSCNANQGREVITKTSSDLLLQLVKISALCQTKKKQNGFRRIQRNLPSG